MRKIVFRALVFVFVLGVVAFGAFQAGRFAAPAARFEPASTGAGGDELTAAWADFIRAQEQSIALLRDHEFFGTEQEQAEAYRGILYGLIGAIQNGALPNPDQPRFVRSVDWTSKSGLDNPDNDYYVATLRDDAEYRIVGTRGTTRNLIFQLVLGQPGVGEAGTSTNISVLDARDMQIEDDGSFEILMSRSDPGPEHNWLPIDDGAETLIVRFTYSDWSSEQAGRLFIERIGGEGVPSPILTPTQMARSLRRAARSLFDRSSTWLRYSNMAWTTMPRNGVSRARPSQGGLVGQYSAFGTWELEEDEALILTTHPTSATYQGIELGNLWFVSLDSETRTSSLTSDQALLGEDGRYHFVISAHDPGIQNWLDTEGHPRGLIMLRWQGLAGAIGDAAQPSTRRIRFDQILEALPAGTPRFGSKERREQIHTRATAAKRRSSG
ncbi:MAG: hypothetical protein CL908_07400 [Deltaproteobacteria bacterium]|nr:hypothetical protein [Deltaproteobacteria bacterium]